VSDRTVKVENIEQIEDSTESIISTDSSPGMKVGEDHVSFKLGDGSSYRFSRRDPRARLWLGILDRNHRKNAPVYVDGQETPGQVSEIFSPDVRFVKAVQPSDKDQRLEVIFLFAPSAYFLNPKHPDFTTMRATLEAAVKSKEAVLVTLNPVTNELLHVREAPGHRQELAPAEGLSSDDPDDEKLNGRPILEALSPTIDMARAEAVFESLRNQEHIPFDFLFDCCYARAHEMCRLMALDDIASRKIWNFGRGFFNDKATLHVFSPVGEFSWSYHVAPIVRVRNNGDVFNLVMDPGISDRALTIGEWLDRQNDDAATRRFTAAGIYGLDIKTQEVIPDFGFTRTPGELNKHTESRDYRRLHEELLSMRHLKGFSPSPHTSEGEHE